jgi:hypothetical protein
MRPLETWKLTLDMKKIYYKVEKLIDSISCSNFQNLSQALVRRGILTPATHLKEVNIASCFALFLHFYSRQISVLDSCDYVAELDLAWNYNEDLDLGGNLI